MTVPRPPAEQWLRARRAAGRKLLVPYVMAGMTEDWVEVLGAVVAAGADAVEVGIPFSDPMIDGPVVQEASVRALAAGATPHGILSALARADVGNTPLAVMTYYNLLSRGGLRRMAHLLAEAGVAAAIVPDLPLDELAPWRREATEAGVETVLLVAPTTPDERLERIVAAARGFVYAVSVMGVTGEREALATSAKTIARRCKARTDLPVLAGVGISTPEQAVEVCEVADGVVVGSAIVRRILDGEGPEGAAKLVASFREALDS